VTSGNLRIRTDLLLLVAFCGFLFFYGLGAFGLLGADEPRYAQIAREMLDRSDWITPTLDGKPWLEKPPLYYWQAMLCYRAARLLAPAPPTAKEQNGETSSDGARDRSPSAGDGVTDHTARLPAAIDAVFLIAAIYVFLRRFRPATELDGALITASCAGVIGFAHAAATDMPLAATFTIALLGWYSWYEGRRRADLVVFYLFLALGTLAKGPVAPALAGVIVLLFAAATRDWRLISRTLWLPGIALFMVVALPWYVAVQIRNPGFFRFFILEHNLARFSTNVYHHPQPFWFYLPVFLLAAMPWSLWLIAGIVEQARRIWREGRPCANTEDSWPLFLLIWIFVPVLFFSASQSKLPGYILPSVPAAALLVSNYFSARREAGVGVSKALSLAHGILCGMLVFGALSTARVAAAHHLALDKGAYIAAAVGAVVAIVVASALVTRGGSQLLRSLTMAVVILCVGLVVRFAAPVIDATQSARPVAQAIQAFSRESVPIAIYRVPRVTEYGLEFYCNQPMRKYEDGGIPEQAHVLVAASDADSGIRALPGGRKVSYLTGIPAQKLALYWVAKE
jgi:4-amino-4-deoxy-L-arabinose transferase-like glycosyltransferase